MIHVSSRGNLYAPKRKTSAMWMRTLATSKFEPQPCTARMNQPEIDIVIERLQTAPRLRCRGNIDKGQQNSGDELQQKNDQSGAAEDVPPACGAARHGMFSGLANRRRYLQTLVEPLSDLRDQAHGRCFPLSAAVPGVGSSPA